MSSAVIHKILGRSDPSRDPNKTENIKRTERKDWVVFENMLCRSKNFDLVRSNSWLIIDDCDTEGWQLTGVKFVPFFLPVIVLFDESENILILGILRFKFTCE